MQVLVADIGDLFRTGLKGAIERLIPGATVFESHDFDGLLETLERSPGIRLLTVDQELLGSQCALRIRDLRTAHPDLPIALFADAADRNAIISALDAGANGFLVKTMSAADVVSCLSRIAAGEIVVPNSITHLTTARLDLPDASVLTPRQRQVAQQLAMGKSTKMIAAELGLGESTVKVHLSAVYKAWGVHSRYQAMLQASQVFAQAN